MCQPQSLADVVAKLRGVAANTGGRKYFAVSTVMAYLYAANPNRYQPATVAEVAVAS